MSPDTPIPPKRRSRAVRSAAIAASIAIAAILFVGGGSALLYLIFSQYSGVQNIWLLVCGAPVLLGIILFISAFNLYIRYGQPLEDFFSVMKQIEAGNLSVRVPDSRSDMFSDLIKRFNKMVGELERAEQQRRNLTADIAHELRTPLHIIQGNLEGLLDGVYEPTPEHITNTLEETRLLARLVNDLQTLSLAETGHLPLHPTRFLMADLLQDVTDSFASLATEKGINLGSDLHSPALEIQADYDRLNQALSNLVSNALRHTPTGGTVDLSASRLEKEGQPWLQIVVRDTGAGIPPEDLPFIFDRFWRADKSRSGRAHSGLGLAITRQLIQAHGGSIEAQSTPGQGSTFTIELPM